MDWFRSWHGAPTDTKWLLVAQKAKVIPGIVSAVAWALMDYASKNNETRGNVSSFDVDEYCAFSGFDPAQVSAIMTAMTEGSKPFIDQTMTLTAWQKRQPKHADNSTDRVRSHRERKRHETDETFHETEGNTDLDQTRPRPERVKDPKPVPVTARARKQPALKTAQAGGSFQGFGSLVGSGLVGSSDSSSFDIRTRFSEDDWDEVTLSMRDYVHHEWDRKKVFEKYNSHFSSDPPKKPVVAFKAWLKRNATWLGRPP